MDGSVPVRQAGRSAPAGRLTFKVLKAAREKLVASGQLGRKAFASDVSALNNFAATHDLTDDDAFAPLLGVSDEEFAERLREYESRATVSAGTMTGYRSRLRTWNDAARELSTRDGPRTALLSDVLSAAIDAFERKNLGTSYKQVAERAGVHPGTVFKWRNGARPFSAPNSVKYAGSLERVLGLPPKTLSSLLRPKTQARRSRRDLVRRRKELNNKVQLNGIRFRPKELPPKLAAFFERLKTYKSTAHVLYDLIGGPLERPRKTWRVQRKGGEVPAYDLYMARFLTRIGWMTLPSSLEGAVLYLLDTGNRVGQPLSPEMASSLAPVFMGKGIPLEDVTPAHLVDPELLGEFIEWRKRRNGDISKEYVQDALMLVTPGGFLRQQPECAWDYAKTKLSPVDVTAPEGEDDYAQRSADWAKMCGRWEKQLRGLLPHVTRKRSRRARDKLQPILALPEPMSVVKGVIEAHAATKPVGRLVKGYSGAVQLALWYRDQVLLRMLASNPLRNRNFREMRYREKPTQEDRGNLYRTPEGAWRLHYEPHEFKNEAGAASETYDVEVSKDLWALIELYIFKARPILLEGDSELVFVSRTGKAMSRVTLSDTIWILTSMSLPDIPGMPDVFGFRSHAFRHLVATAWLKANPEDYLTVKHILHDTLETVLKNYAHDRPDDGLTRYNNWLGTQLKPPQNLDDA
ncbi:helix-turn-helix domain-containing protein [Siccirubricoccus phaeus]|uniref:helix-turn-helix domain-containing protein n=1 Tax=Siccirubricoccus phaeus TaxID=2595053 RepID=UPI0011F34EFE|nr:helix-turn-helix transcriptional regulator [Siccirubricoccus phaeus]